MGPECYSPYYLDYDWARWAEPAYNVPALDINGYFASLNTLVFFGTIRRTAMKEKHKVFSNAEKQLPDQKNVVTAD